MIKTKLFGVLEEKVILKFIKYAKIYL